jgi:hypothetical protein
MKRNILTLLTSSYGGGAERLVLNQMNLYDRDKFNLHVITFRPGQLEEDFRNAGVKYCSLNVKQKLSLSALMGLNRYIKKNRIELLHAHLIEPEVYTVPIMLMILGKKWFGGWLVKQYLCLQTESFVFLMR